MTMDERKDSGDILFGYSNVPACGDYEEEDGGFSIAVYEDGTVIHKTYLFPEITKTETAYKVTEGSVNAIKTLLKKRQKIIQAFSSHLDNGTYDGEGNYFIFNGKEVITWNIQYTNPLFFLLRGKDLPVAKQENRLLALFFTVAKILRRDGIDLALDQVSFSISPP